MAGGWRVMCDECRQLEKQIQTFRRYAVELENELMPQLRGEDPVTPEDPIVPMIGPPVSQIETFEREPEDLDELTRQLEEAEAEVRAAENAQRRAWILRCRIQDGQLRRRWEERDRRWRGRAWQPPALVGTEGGDLAETAEIPNPGDPAAPPVPTVVGQQPIESIAELAGKPPRPTPPARRPRRK